MWILPQRRHSLRLFSLFFRRCARCRKPARKRNNKSFSLRQHHPSGATAKCKLIASAFVGGWGKVNLFWVPQESKSAARFVRAMTFGKTLFMLFVMGPLSLATQKTLMLSNSSFSLGGNVSHSKCRRSELLMTGRTRRNQLKIATLLSGERSEPEPSPLGLVPIPKPLKIHRICIKIFRREWWRVGCYPFITIHFFLSSRFSVTERRPEKQFGALRVVFVRPRSTNKAHNLTGPLKIRFTRLSPSTMIDSPFLPASVAGWRW